MSASTMTATAGSIRSTSPTMRWDRARAIWSIAANTAAASTGATRCALPGAVSDETSRSYEAWQKLGVTRADGQPFPNPNLTAKLWVPVAGGPAFLLGPNFYAVKTYNPSMNYTLAIVHLGDRVPAAGRSCSRSRTASARRRWPKCRRCRSASPRPASIRRHRRPRRQHHDAGRAQFPAKGGARSGGRVSRAEAAGEAARRIALRRGAPAASLPGDLLPNRSFDAL